MDTATALTSPDVQFVGCVLCLDRHTARRVLTGMHAGDLADPAASHVLQLAIEVLAEGRDPRPVTLFTHAQTTGQATGEHPQQWLSLWLAEAYGAATGTAPAHTATHLKTAILRLAWRRAITEHAHRLQQAAHEAPDDVLAELLDDTAHLDALRTRAETAHTTGAHQFAPQEVAA